MSDIRIVDLRDKTEIKEKAAEWFHSKWGVPMEAYLECMVQGDGEPDMTKMYIHS